MEYLQSCARALLVTYDSLRERKKIMSWRLCCLLVSAVLQQSVVSASQWPYLQTYPPVNESDDRTPLYFALVLSFGGNYRSIGALPGVQIALDYINRQSSILPGYTLHYTLSDSQASLSAQAYSDNFYTC